MRPFEAARRVYLVFGADLMNEDAADALLKDLEEPPDYVVLVLVAEQPSRLPETIRSRCQLVPFQRLSRRALEEHLARAYPELDPAARAVAARAAVGRIDRAERLLGEEGAAWRGALIEVCRSVYREEAFDPAQAAATIVEAARARGQLAAAADADTAEGTSREREQRARRIARGAEREAIVEALELLAGWYRDLLAASVGAGQALLNADRAAELASDAAHVSTPAAERALEAVLETRRSFELNVSAPLALEALFVRLRQALAGISAAPRASV
jgi:DNA polymerase-3 subunit delta'